MKNKKNKKNNPTSGQQSGAFNKKKYIREAARKLPIVHTLMDDSIDTVGMGYVIIARKRANGQIVFANYLVDKFCLGVKDVYYDILDEETYDELIQEMQDRDDTNMVEVSTGYLHNLVYGAIEYAEELGFAPHKDFEVAEYILDDIEEVDFEEIEFGKDGMPAYIAGPGDKTGRILGTLNKSVGEGNYIYFLHNNEFGEELGDEFGSSAEWDDDDEEWDDDNKNFDETNDDYTEYKEVNDDDDNE